MPKLVGFSRFAALTPRDDFLLDGKPAYMSEG